MDTSFFLKLLVKTLQIGENLPKSNCLTNIIVTAPMQVLFPFYARNTHV